MFTFILQAEEQLTTNSNVQLDNFGKFSRATIVVKVLSSNLFDPVVSSNTGSFTGQIAENADVGTLVRAQLNSNTVMQLTVTDQDVVCRVFNCHMTVNIYHMTHHPTYQK